MGGQSLSVLTEGSGSRYGPGLWMMCGLERHELTSIADP